MTDAPPCRVILLGMMGSGKTTVGTLLAERAGWPYHDNDQLLSAATGRTARELALEGTRSLRDAEAAALRLAMRQPEPSIVAAAAGVILDPVLRDELRRAGTVVWLRAPSDVLAERAERGPHRPWLDADAAGWIAAQATEREHLYRATADVVVDTDTEPPERAVDLILDAAARTACAAWLGTRPTSEGPP